MKLIRTSTVPSSLNTFCRGLLRELSNKEGYDVVAVSSPGKDLDEIAERERITTIAVPMRRQISPIHDLISLSRLIHVFKKEKPHLVHSITPKAGMLSMLAAWLCRVPVRLHTFTGLVFPTSTGIKRRILIFTDRVTCACATHIVPEGEGVKADLMHYRITRKPLQVLGHGNIRGIDLSYYDPTLPDVRAIAANIRDKDRFTFIYVGRIVRSKGIDELILAFSKLNKEYPSTRLLLVGVQEANQDLISKDSIALIDSNPNIETVGPQKDVRPWYVASDVLVFPSHREGFPNVVIEAGAMGLPSIVTDINGSREIIVEGKNGTIIPSKDTEMLMRSMRHMLIDTEWRSQLAMQARDMIESRYEQKYVWKCLLTYYKEILNG